jgi:hypothetical protein
MSLQRATSHWANYQLSRLVRADDSYAAVKCPASDTLIETEAHRDFDRECLGLAVTKARPVGRLLHRSYRGGVERRVRRVEHAYLGHSPVRQYDRLKSYIALNLGCPRVPGIVGRDSADSFWIGHDVAAWFSGQRRHDRRTDGALRGRGLRAD